jgi:hypothetical protein
VTRRVTRSVLAWCFFWLLLAPAWAAQAGTSCLDELTLKQAQLQAYLPGLADDDEDFVPAQEFVARTSHREDFSGDVGPASDVGPLAGFAVDCPFVAGLRERARSSSSNSGFLVHRTLHPRAPPA